MYQVHCVPGPLCSDPLCTRPIVSESRCVRGPLCVPVPLCPRPIVYQAHCVLVPLCTRPIMCTSPSVYQAHCVPGLLPLCPRPVVFRPAVYQAHCVLVPLCTRPIMCTSPIVYQARCVPGPLCVRPIATVSQARCVPGLLCHCRRYKPTELAHSFFYFYFLYSVLVSFSVCMALSTVFHPIHFFPTTLRFLTLFFRSYPCLIGPVNYIPIYESPSAHSPDVILRG